MPTPDIALGRTTSPPTQEKPYKSTILAPPFVKLHSRKIRQGAFAASLNPRYLTIRGRSQPPALHLNRHSKQVVPRVRPTSRSRYHQAKPVLRRRRCRHGTSAMASAPSSPSLQIPTAAAPKSASAAPDATPPSSPLRAGLLYPQAAQSPTLRAALLAANAASPASPSSPGLSVTQRAARATREGRDSWLLDS